MNILNFLATLLTISGDLIYLHWLKKEYDPSRAHSCEQAEKVLKSRAKSLMLASAINLVIIGLLLLVNSFQWGIGLIVVGGILLQFC